MIKQIPQSKDDSRYRHHHSRKDESYSKHSRERSRSYSRRRSYERRSRSRNRSRSSRSDDDRRYHKKDSMKRIPYDALNSSFSFLENGEMKINTDFIVPDHLVSLLQGTNQENVRAIMNKSGAIVTFSKEVII